MQNAAFGASGVDGIYVALDVSPDRLPRALEGLHAAGFAGLNLTLPHKEAGARLCVRLTPEAERAGAVNTLGREATGWLGHATDGSGFRGWIAECGVPVKGGRVLLLGAGGAARCVAPEIVALGASALTVVSRNGGHAQALIARLRLGEASTTALAARPLDDTRAARGSEGFDLLIRALSTEEVGASEAAWWGAVASDAPVLDLNYGERADATRERARSGGRRFEDGLGLLVHQGAASFEFWTGARAPLGVMHEALGAR
jgi:shikimate dehydrogenase